MVSDDDNDDKETLSAGENETSDLDLSEDDVRVGVKNLRPKESRLNDADLKPFLSGFPDCKTFIGFSAFIFFTVGCIWRFMNCSGSLGSAECEEEFTDCSDSLQDDGSSGWKGLPEGPTISFQTLDIKEGQ